jgi:hypothetical protein
MVEPVEYAVAVDRYLDAVDLRAGSRRVYRIALAMWAWPLVGRTPPVGPARRRANPPVVPLSLLEGPAAPARLRAACTARALTADPRTLNRELSILRSALRWWRSQGWLDGEPLAAADTRGAPVPKPSTRHLNPDEVRAVLSLRASLREQTLWHFLHDTGAPIERVLALDVADLDLARCRTHGRTDMDLRWRARTAQLLSLLLLNRTSGPLFLTDRRARAGIPAADRCPLTGRGRLSYRRAAEIFTAATRPLDPSGRGWTLRQLRGERDSSTTARR